MDRIDEILLEGDFNFNDLKHLKIELLNTKRCNEEVVETK